MSFMDLFFKQENANPAPSAPAPGNPAVANPGTPAKLGDPPVKTANENGTMPGTGELPPNPLDVYKKMFDNAANPATSEPPSFALDPKVVNEVAGKMDFTAGLDQEMLTKALSGDASALLSVIKASSQNAYKTALEHTTALSDAHLKQRTEFDQKRIASGVRRQLTESELANVPNFDHPVVAAQLKSTAAAFARANPDATPQQIATAAKQYITDLASALNPSAPGSTDSTKAGEVDWDKYFNS